MKRGDILMQSLMWAYNGLEITFWSGVYPTCIGQTKQLANRFGVVGLSGIIVGVGEIAGDFCRFSIALSNFFRRNNIDLDREHGSTSQRPFRTGENY